MTWLFDCFNAVTFCQDRFIGIIFQGIATYILQVRIKIGKSPTPWWVHYLIFLRGGSTSLRRQLANWTSPVYFVAISSTSGNPEFPLDHRDDWLGDHPHPCNARYSLDIVQQNYHAFLTLPQHSELEISLSQFLEGRLPAHKTGWVEMLVGEMVMTSRSKPS